MTHRAPTWLRPTVDYGPLVVFFAAYWFAGLMPATAALLAVTAVMLAVSLIVERRVPVVPLVTAAVVGIFGGLTLWFQDETFIKMKPTIVQALFSAVLLGGLAMGKPLLKPVMQVSWPMDDTGWRRLSFRFAIFFAAMAGLNELVWRTQSTDFWVNFKIFGILGLTLAFVATQTPLMQRHHLAEDDERASGDE